MVRNFGKGGKGCKKLKNSVDSHARELIFKEHGQEYAIVKELLGNGRCICVCGEHNVERLCIIRGNMRKRSINRIYKGDFVLVALREYQDSKADIVHLYNMDEVRLLCTYGEISNEMSTKKWCVASATNDSESDLDDNNIVFEDD